MASSRPRIRAAESSLRRPSMLAWLFITRWGNSLLLLPAASWIGVSLWLGGERPIAFRWMASFGAAVTLVLASKVAFLGWGIGIPSLDFTGISGHTFCASAVFPMFAWWLAQDRDVVVRRGAVAFGVALALAIGVSRLMLAAHSVSEVIAGAALGFAVAYTAIPREPVVNRRYQLRWLALCALIAMGAASRIGDSEEAHGLVTTIALALSGHSVPFTRDML
jgi:membrane-associated phospholipid phosphatase